VAGVAVGADAAAVDVVADSTAGFGASCFWHPVTAKTVETAATAMITEIFFTILHLLSFRERKPQRACCIAVNLIKNALQRSEHLVNRDNGLQGQCRSVQEALSCFVRCKKRELYTFPGKEQVILKR
jgi:hypothetical protein